MYDYLIGEVKYKGKNLLTLEVNCVGYSCIVSDKTMHKLGDKKRVKLYIYFLVREDLQKFYGFYDLTEKECFIALCKIPGVGAKSAINILSYIDPQALQSAVFEKNSRAFEIVPGVGKKMATKILVELKDKLSKITISSSNSNLSNAISALIGLGYNPLVAQQKAMKFSQGLTVKEIISAVLKDKS